MKTQIDPTWQSFYKAKQSTVRDQLMVKYLGLVHYVVNKLFKTMPTNVDREDLVNIGVIGLSEALDRFNPYFGIKFETYAIPRIRGAIIDELRKQDWIPRSLRSKSNKIKKAVEELEQAQRGEVSSYAVASQLGISESEYHQWQSQLNRTSMISLDKPNPNFDDSNLYEAIEDTTSENPVEFLEDVEMKALLVKVIKKLPEKYRLAITLYYYEQLTFKEIGKILNVSESRISQIHSETIDRLKRMLTKEYAD
ncbi:MAG TPA: FliA/WhiG family RNA polymerase sigma factor [Calditrichia bacterium]|nr:FliA/WhiG family RNA polymerase sigma factor [Calditrichia bacterium]HQV31547.1 FliA/WhiG family RNA polymerase sigma factor [Calditrichia bacterium]